MKVLSVNVSGPKPLTYRGQTVMTGIFKTPVLGRIRVHRLGLEGDVQVDKRVHGGPDKAVYIYPHEHYPHWIKFMAQSAPHLSQKEFAFGQFGENLTTFGLLEDETRVGDTLRVGSALLQVTQPREPCFKLMTKMNDFTFAEPFLASGRTGFYLRVLEEGEVSGGDAIERVATETSAPTIREVVEQLINQ
jgi:MOSC domain-containing protein YiiM